MILYKNRLILMNYEPASDILSVDWPTLAGHDLPKLKRSLDALLGYIEEYHIRRLLIDSTNATVNPKLDLGAYAALLAGFAETLQGTCLEKVARVLHADSAREEETRKAVEGVIADVGLRVQHRGFPTKAAATAWLLS